MLRGLNSNFSCPCAAEEWPGGSERTRAHRKHDLVKRRQFFRQANQAEGETLSDGKIWHKLEMLTLGVGRKAAKQMAGLREWSATAQDRLPEREDNEVLAQLLFGGFADLTDTLLRNA